MHRDFKRFHILQITFLTCITFVFAYLDDVIVATEIVQDHLYWLEKTINRLMEARLTLSPDKCLFCRLEVKYLGFKINQDDLVVDDNKMRAILEYPCQRNLRQLRRFIGATSWYRRFIKDYAKMCEPLTRLTKKV